MSLSNELSKVHDDSQISCRHLTHSLHARSDTYKKQKMDKVMAGMWCSMPEICGIEYRIKARACVKHPATTGGPFGIVQKPRKRDVILESQYSNSDEDPVTPRTGVPNVQMVPAASNDGYLMLRWHSPRY